MKRRSNQLTQTLIVTILMFITIVLSSISLQAQQGERPEIRPGVRQAAQQDGRVRVIINLRLPQDLVRIQNTLGGHMPMDRLANTIADAQNSVLDTLEPGRNRGVQFRSSKFEMLHQYDMVPALAGYLTPRGITALENNPLIASIQIDETGTGGLGQARNIIGAQYVQPNFGINGEGQKVAVVDSGVDLDHPYLADDINGYGVCFTFYNCATSTNPNANLPQSGYADDKNGHGTAVSGIITSNSGSNTGVAPGVIIVPVRVLDWKNEGFVSDWVAGLNWIITNQGGLGVDVVSLSIQTGATYSANCDAVYPSLASPINTLVNNMNIPVVAITGNYGLANASAAPGCMSNVFAIGATYDYYGGFNETGCTDSAAVDKLACFTNGGSLLDLVAPGAIINAPNFVTGQDSPWSGTSAAAPMVSGALAMMRQLAPNDSPASLMNTLRLTGKPVFDPRNGLTYKRLNIPAALEFYDRISTTSPNNTADVVENDPLFTFEDRTYSTYFQVEIKNITANQSTTSKWVQRTGSICNGTTCSARFGTNIVAGSNQWRVRTYFAGQGPGQWSNWRSFFAIGPTLGSPSNNETINTATPTYNWAPVGSATWYRVYVTNGAGFTYSGWFDAASICPSTCSVTPTAFEAILKDGSYTWYVLPWRGQSYGVWGGPKQFTVDVAAPGNPTNQVPTNTDTRTPMFHWTVGGGGLSTWFQVRVRQSSDDVVVYQKWYKRPDVCGSPSGTSCSAISEILLVKDTTYKVDVRAWGPGGISPDYSNFQSFTINLPVPVTPQNLAISVNRGDPQFRWNYDSNALWYHLIVTNVTDNIEILNKWYKVGDTLSCTSVCGIFPGLSLKNGTYDWRVGGWGPGGTSPAEAPGPQISLNYQTPYTPNNAAMYAANLETLDNTSRVTLTWPDVTNDGIDNEASWYELYIGDPNGNKLHRQWYRRRNIDCNGIVCNVSPLLNLSNGVNYRWFIRGWGPGGKGDWSAVANFTLDGAPQDVKPDVTGAMPTGTISNNYPTFTWSTCRIINAELECGGTTWVRLYVARSDKTKMYDKWLTVENLGCAGGTGTCTADQNALGGLVLKDGNYKFFIRFYGPAGTSPWSNAVLFAVDGPVSGIVSTNLLPADNTTQSDHNVTFNWDAASNTTWYRLKLTNLDKGTNSQEWITSTDLGCGGGGTCSVTRTLDPAIYDWTIATWGPGNASAGNQENTPRQLTILK